MPPTSPYYQDLKSKILLATTLRDTIRILKEVKLKDKKKATRCNKSILALENILKSL